MSTTASGEWLALLHQLPTRPPYLRVKVWRRLQAIGAVPLKNAVHVLPRSEANELVLRELLAEIEAGGGEAVLLDARLLAGQSDVELRTLFDAARDSDYAEVTASARRLLENGPAGSGDIARLQKQLADVIALDFFGAHGRQAAEAALAELDRRRYQHPDVGRNTPSAVRETQDLRGRVWVTRRGVHVDRIACAWLIQRAIDPDAALKFVDGRNYEPTAGELRFDMAEGEFTHEGDRCSFETLLARAGLEEDPALDAIAQMIHDLDIGDSKFGRPETAGLGAMLAGICASTGDDLERIAIGGAALDQFRAFFSRKKNQR